MGEDDEDLGEDNGELRLLVPRLDPTVRAEDVVAIRGMREDDAIELLREYGIARLRARGGAHRRNPGGNALLGYLQRL